MSFLDLGAEDIAVVVAVVVVVVVAVDIAVVAVVDSSGGKVVGRCWGPWVASAARLFFQEGDSVDIDDTAGSASGEGSAAGSGRQL